MRQHTIPPADEDQVRNFIQTIGGWVPVRQVYVRFGQIAAQKRLRLLEGQEKVKLTGRGRNRAVRDVMSTI